MNKKLLFLVGLMLRELLSFWTGHPYDFEVWVRVGYYVAQGNDPYTYLFYIEGISFAPYEVILSIGYPPMWALICGLMYNIYRISEGFFAYSPPAYFFLLKQPAIIGDLLVGIIFWKFFVHGKDYRPLAFWILNPLTIIASSVWGIFDSLTLALLLLSIKYQLFDENDALSGIFLGIATSLKLIPLIFAPINLRLAAKKTQFIVSFALAVLATALLPFFAFGWGLSGFYHAMESQAINIREQPAIGGMTVFALLEPVMRLHSPDFLNDYVILPLNYFWIAAFLIFYAFLYTRPTNELRNPGVIRLHIIASLLFLLTRLFIAEQYVLYVVGLMILDVFILHSERRTLLETICAFSLIYLTINNTLFVRFLSPLAPWAFNWDVTFNNSPPSETIRHILRLLAAFLFYASTLQLLRVYARDRREKLQSWVIARIKNALKLRFLKYYLYLVLLTISVLFLDYVIMNIVTDRHSVLDQIFSLNISLFGLYHLLLGSFIVVFDVSVCLFMTGSLEERLKTFARLMLLNIVMIGIAQPFFQVLSQRPPLSGESVYAMGLLLDERLFVSYSITTGIIGLFIVEDVFKLVKERILHGPWKVIITWNSRSASKED